MTLLDPVEEFMSVCQQRDISALGLPYPGPAKEQCSYSDSGIMGGLLLPRPLSSVSGSQLNAIYFESSRKVCTGVLMLSPWLGPNNVNRNVIYSYKLQTLKSTLKTTVE
ncbi:hypothetical protein XENOCAPTIV_029948 [Xenoophorus captivus]|uniref:Uncharacterized protein n=1 Tax=Xenoophorus captivus TaxID=1517983 RepID=A0ABV0QNR8_9TELE